MARTEPGTPDRWAESADPGDISVPPAGVRNAGYQFEDIFTHGEFNALLRDNFQWIRYLMGTGMTYPSLASAMASLRVQIGDVVTITDEGTHAPWSVVAEPACSSNVVDIDGNGEIVCVMTADQKVRICNEDGTVSATLSPSGMGAATVIAVGLNGFVTMQGISIRYYNFAGTFQWTYNHGATITDVCIDGGRVYLCGAASATITHRALGVTLGNLLWSGSHGATLNSIVSTGQEVIISGALGTGAVNTRRLLASTGVSTGAASTRFALGRKSIHTDGTHIFFATGSGIFRTDYLTAGTDNVIAGTYAAVGPVAGVTAVDHQFLYFRPNASTGVVGAMPKSGQDTSRSRLLAVRGGAATVRAVYSNGRRLFIGYDTTGGFAFTVLRTTGLSQRFERRDITLNTFNPMGTQQLVAVNTEF